MTTKLLDGILSGNKRAVARLLTRVENDREGVADTLATLFKETGNAWTIGVTGAPGTGKSTLVNALAKAYREQDKTVAIIAVDPTSPYSGGAILGDRIRMRDLSGDSGVFIRSMATRGNLGGLSRAVRDAMRVLDAAGFERVIVETVGAGQSEVDIVRTTQTTVVVEAPGLGDDVQAIKAGILEIADVLVVNKADRPGASNTLRSLKTMLDLGHPASRTQLLAHHGQVLEVHTPIKHDDALWLPPLVQTIANAPAHESGIETLINAIADHRQFLFDTNLAEQMEQQRVQLELHDLLQAALMEKLMTTLPENTIEVLVQQVYAREIDPHQAVAKILQASDL